MPKLAFETMGALPSHETRRPLPRFSTARPSEVFFTSVDAAAAGCGATGSLEPGLKYANAPNDRDRHASAASITHSSQGRPVVCRACLAGAIDFCRCSGGGTGRGADAATGCNSVWVASGRDALDASASAAKGNTITGQSKSSPSPQKQKRALPILDSVVSICKNTALG